MLLNDEKNDILQIIDKYSNMIYRICLVYLKNHFDAEDAYQDLFIKVFKKAPKFINNDHEKAWIIRVTTNHCKNVLKYKRIRKYIFLSDDVIGIENVNINDTLQQILNLDLQYRSVLYLYYYEGYTTKEIAIILGKKDATIRTWLNRARKKLKDLVGGELYE